MLLSYPAMNKPSIIKLSVIICLALSASFVRAQDSASSRPVRTAPKTMIANPRLQKPVTQTGAVPNHTTTPGMHRSFGPVKPAAGTKLPATTGAATGAYRQPAAAYHQPAPYTAGAAAPAITDKSLYGQYQYLLTKVYGYQRPMVAAFYKNITDSLVIQKRKVRELSASLASQNKTVKDLQTDVDSKKESLDESASKADSISLLGIAMSKSTYNTLMWGLVIAFGAVAAIVIVQSGSNRREARYRTKLYDDLDTEYKTYKTKANEKEKKLARELQTVRNKLEEITGNPEY